MKKVITIILLTIFLTVEISILYSNNIKYQEKNKILTEEIENIGRINEAREEKNKLEEEIRELLSQKTASLDNMEEVIEEENLANANLESEILDLENNIKLLEGGFTKLQTKYNELLKKEEQENTFYITGVPTINQYPDYPTGCESVALTILLNYYGVEVSPLDIIDKLPKGELPYKKDGITYGGNPEEEFIGNPLTTNSYGVYEKPLAKVAETYREGIKIGTGTSFGQLLKIVKQGKPVIAWTSMNLALPYISESWTFKETGEKIYWKAGEHAVVIVGYTKDKVIISDPIGGKIKYQSRFIFEERYNYFGKKALYY